MKAKHITLNSYSDAGHGWAKVPVKLLQELDLINEISKYSYINGSFAYLEEDCDLVKFVLKIQSMNWTWTFINHSSIRSSVRNYDSFSAQAVKNHSKVPAKGMRVAHGDDVYELLMPLNRGAWMVRLVIDGNSVGNSYTMSGKDVKAAAVTF